MIILLSILGLIAHPLSYLCSFKAPCVCHLKSGDITLVCQSVDGSLVDLEVFGYLLDSQDVVCHWLAPQGLWPVSKEYK